MDPSTSWSNVTPYPCPGLAASSQPTSFPVNISSYFRRPAKIVKPSSRDHSPKNLLRRRTTASHSTTRHRAAWRGSAWSYSVSGVDGSHPAATTRPISWHPNSVNPTPVNDWTPPYPFPDSAYPRNFVNDPFTTAEVHGLVTPLAQPSSSAPCHTEAFTPLDELRVPDLDSPYCFPEPAGYDSFWPSQHPASQPHLGRETYTTDLQTPVVYPLARGMSAGTAPPTPDLFPTSTHQVAGEGEEAAGPQCEDEVLVGMGLYDTPSPVSSTVLQGSQFVLPHRGYAGKGLKLEETFEPSTEEDSDGDDDGSDGEESEHDAGTLHFLPMAATPKTQSGDSGPYPGVTSLADQSFFFSDEQEQDRLLEQSYTQHFAAPIWTDVYSGAACNWV